MNSIYRLACGLLLIVITFVLSASPVQAATLTVNTLVDENDGSCTDSYCSLRDAVTSATAGDTINFSVTGTILLTQTHGPILISKDLDISGPGASNLTIDGNGSVIILYVTNDATLSISGLTLSNSASAGIYNDSAKVVATNVNFSDNHDAGGSINNSSGMVTVTNSTFSNNHGEGSSILNSAGTMTVNNSIFINNSGTSGGAVDNVSGTLNAVNCTFSDNHSLLQGGAIDNFAGTLNVTASTFTNNHAGTSGGAIYEAGSSMVNVINSTFSGNAANTGGGFYNFNGKLNVTNSTLSGNSAAYGANGIYSNVGTVVVKNTIIANRANGGNCHDVFSTDSTHNLATDSTCSPGFTQVISAQLALGTLTGSPAYFPLNPGSVAINAGADSACPATDQRGFPRPFPPGEHCDIGAFELGYRSIFLPLIVR